MNRTELLQATVRFTSASHEYVQLIATTFIADGTFYPSITAQRLKMISKAKAKRDELEKIMYEVWDKNGIGDGHVEP